MLHFLRMKHTASGSSHYSIRLMLLLPFGLLLLILLVGCAGSSPAPNPNRKLIYGVLQFPCKPIPVRPENNNESIRRIEAPVTVNDAQFRWHRVGRGPYVLERFVDRAWVPVPAFHDPSK